MQKLGDEPENENNSEQFNKAMNASQSELIIPEGRE